MNYLIYNKRGPRNAPYIPHLHYRGICFAGVTVVLLRGDSQGVISGSFPICRSAQVDLSMVPRWKFPAPNMGAPVRRSSSQDVNVAHVCDPKGSAFGCTPRPPQRMFGKTGIFVMSVLGIACAVQKHRRIRSGRRCRRLEPRKRCRRWRCLPKIGGFYPQNGW